MAVPAAKASRRMAAKAAEEPMTPSFGPSATGSSTAKPRPFTGPPSAWMSTATSAWASLMMAARVVTHGPMPALLVRVMTTVAPSASRSACR